MVDGGRGERAKTRKDMGKSREAVVVQCVVLVGAAPVQWRGLASSAPDGAWNGRSIQLSQSTVGGFQGISGGRFNSINR